MFYGACGTDFDARTALSAFGYIRGRGLAIYEFVDFGRANIDTLAVTLALVVVYFNSKIVTFIDLHISQIFHLQWIVEMPYV